MTGKPNEETLSSLILRYLKSKYLYSNILSVHKISTSVYWKVWVVYSPALKLQQSMVWFSGWSSVPSSAAYEYSSGQYPVSEDMHVYLVLSPDWFLLFCFFFSGCSDDILDEATRHHLFTDTFCRVCWAVLPFESQRMSHYEVAWKGGFFLASTGALVCLRFLHGVREGCLKSFPKLMLGLDISQTWRLWMMRAQW